MKSSCYIFRSRRILLALMDSKVSKSNLGKMQWYKYINIYIYIYIYDEAVNITSEPHTQNGTCTISKENLAESNGVVPAEYPPKVKLKLFSQLYSARKWYNMHTLICEGIGVFIVVEGWPPFLGVEVFPYRNHLALSQTWWTRYFLIEKILINMRIFRNPFCARIPLI